MIKGRYEHKKTGSIYRVVFVTNKSTTNEDKFPVTVVYESSIGALWSRPLVDFNEKFNKI